MKIDQDTNNVFSLLWPANEKIASTALDLNLLKTAILFRSETLSISIRDFFWQFWEGALGPFRLGKLAR